MGSTSVNMKAIVLESFGPPSNLIITDVPKPVPQSGQALIRIKAFGLNRAEMYMRQGKWPESMPIIGVECVGIVEECPDKTFPVGTAVAAVMGGLGRTLNGSYTEYTVAPVTNMVTLAASESNLLLPWDQIAAIPITYATAWECLFGNLDLKKGQKLLIRGATSSLGRAAVNLAVNCGAHVTATTRDPQRHAQLLAAGVDAVEAEGLGLSNTMDLSEKGKFDAVLELVANTTLLESMTLVRRGGHLCMAGFLGGLAPLQEFNPPWQMATGVHFSFFGSFVFGNEAYPLSEVPLEQILQLVAQEKFDAKPSRVFKFGELQDAHILMEAGKANGKLVALGY
jgi:NADPH:quinone reductase